MLKYTMDYNLKPISDKYSRELRNDGPIVRLLSEKIIKDISKYVPKDTSKLKKSIKYKQGVGIQWESPYAKYVYGGKTSSGKSMVYNRSSGSPLAGPMWDKRYYADNESNLINYSKKLISNIK